MNSEEKNIVEIQFIKENPQDILTEKQIEVINLNILTEKQIDFNNFFDYEKMVSFVGVENSCRLVTSIQLLQQL
jgi:hypothetical protein